jgi:tRNA-specific 2-thiouridylase
VGLSGGVDSSVAAYLLKKEGYNVVGVHLRCWNESGCDVREAEDARRVAEQINIPFYVFDLEKEYRERVVDYMIEGYRNGITPNPDVMCNREIKFGLFLERALKMGADYVATGHYVKLRRTISRNQNSFVPATKLSSPSARHPTAVGAKLAGLRDVPQNSSASLSRLYIAADSNKDQSYFLWTLTQEQLKHCLFPLGGYLKEEVRRIARSMGLPTAEKKDSQGICFIGKVSLADFLARYIPEKKGVVLTTEGVKIGEHCGAQFYTIGQRHINIESEIPISNFQKVSRPYYVVDKNTSTNTLVIAEGEDNPALYRRKIRLADINFIRPLEIRNSKLGISVYARVRYRQPLARAVLRDNELTFDKPQKFVAPGQSAVFYSEKGEMLGGGVIVSSI